MIDIDRLKNPEVFQINRLKAHSDHIIYESKEAYEAKENGLRFLLNGYWFCTYAKNPQLALPGFYQEEVSAKSWDSIKVPGHIQLQGYDSPQYANVQYPWEGYADIEPGQIPMDYNPTMSYVKYFTVPNNMEDRANRKIIVFEGVESGFDLWLNGKYIGYSEDSFMPSEFDITDVLKSGENKLAVRVYKWTSGSWMEDQDFFRFSGIFRDVYIYAMTDNHLNDLKVTTGLNEDYTQGSLNIEGEVLFPCQGRIDLKVTYKQTLIVKETLLIDNIKEMNTDTLHIKTSLKIDNPLLWSAEIPNLYQVSLDIFTDDSISGYIHESFGFREFKMDQGIMKINGQRIVFKGVNRHEFTSNHGRVMSEAVIIHDLNIMKQNNINAIRTSHYPNVSAFYRLCDEYGFYVIDETNMETHGTWPFIEAGESYDLALPGDRQEWKAALLDRVNSLYQRDKNRTSVIIWSLGNESFGGSVIQSMADLYRELDSSRLVHYEGINFDRRYPNSSDMESQMYPSVDKIKSFLKEHPEKPFICCEYTHAMANSCGGMHKYTDLTDTEPLYQGGFIWDFVDQGIQIKNRYGESFIGYGGDFNDRPNDGNFSGNGIIDGYRQSTPKLQEVKYNYQNINVSFQKDNPTNITIFNKNLFTSTSAYECIVTYKINGHLKNRVIVETDVKPLEKGSIELKLDLDLCPGTHVISVSFSLKEDQAWADKGYVIAFDECVFKEEAVKDVDECNLPINVIQSRYNIGVQGEHFHVLFSKLHGGLVSYKFAGREMLKGKVLPNFWRSPVDNDMGNFMPQRYGQWKLASQYLTYRPTESLSTVEAMKYPKIDQDKNSVTVTFRYYLPTKPMAYCDLSFKVTGDGQVNVKLVYDPIKELGDMPEFSVIFKLPADYNCINWFGLGPEETYWDRHRGAKYDCFSKNIEEMMANYLVPQETGNIHDLEKIRILDYQDNGISFSGDSLSVSVLPYSPHEIENASHAYELPPIHYTYVRVGLKQMGIAGDDSWGAKTHEEYLLPVDKRLKLEFSFIGI